jgi:hypothetical protein
MEFGSMFDLLELLEGEVLRGDGDAANRATHDKVLKQVESFVLTLHHALE